MAYHPNRVAGELVKISMKRQTITYTDLGVALCRAGASPGRGLGPYLDACQDWLKKYNLPPLTSLVVRKETGRPSSEAIFFGKKFGDMTDEEINSLQTECFDFQWTEKHLKALGVHNHGA